MVTRKVWMPLAFALCAACYREPREPTDYPAECPPESQWDGYRCVRTDVACPDGTAWEGGKCVALSTATSDPLVGAFSVSGARPDGQKYTGDAAIASIGTGASGPFKITWTVASTTYSGVGIRRGDFLSVGWSDGDHHGVVDFVAKGDGTLTGAWFDAHSGAQPGQEVLTGGLPNLAGVYTIQTGVTPQGGKYTGTCDLVVVNEVHYLLWHVNKDSFRGLGVRTGDVLSVGFSTEPSGNFGVVQYKIEGTKLVGRWFESSQKAPVLGSETLTKK